MIGRLDALAVTLAEIIAAVRAGRDRPPLTVIDGDGGK
jgi:hypothetical protein